jgi:hypothetical protein
MVGGGGLSHHADVGALKKEGYEYGKQPAMSAEFTLPEPKSVGIGGRLIMPEGHLMPTSMPLHPNAQNNAKSGGPNTNGNKNHVSNAPQSMNNINATPVAPNCRIEIPANQSGINNSREVLNTLANNISELLTALKCDYDLSVSNLKWSVVSSLDCSYTRFSVVVLSDDMDGYVVDVYRKEGSVVTFRRIYQHLENALLNYPANVKSFMETIPNVLSVTKALPKDVLAGRVIDSSTLNPLLEMAQSNIIDQQLYAAQVTARLVSSTPFREGMIKEGKLLPALVSLAKGIDVGATKPFQHAILRHVAFVLATLSEDGTTRQALIGAGAAEVSFKVCTAAGGENCRDVCSRREAIRCLQILLSDDDVRGAAMGKLDEMEDGGWRERLQGFRRIVKDKVLRARLTEIEKEIC